LAPSKINVVGVELENVSSSFYLGSLITANTVSDKNILRRISLSQASFQQLYSCLFFRADISIDTNMRVYSVSVRTVFPYGCESWSSTADFVSRLNSCEMGFMRRMLGATQIPYMTNDAVRLRCHTKESLSTIIKSLRLTWLGHALRMNPERIQRQILTGRSINWHRPRGRPNVSWDRMIHSDIGSLTNCVRQLRYSCRLVVSRNCMALLS